MFKRSTQIESVSVVGNSQLKALEGAEGFHQGNSLVFAIDFVDEPLHIFITQTLPLCLHTFVSSTHSLPIQLYSFVSGFLLCNRLVSLRFLLIILTRAHPSFHDVRKSQCDRTRDRNYPKFE
jgi:hypothetical protein